jgi:DNA-directed RNA polymerase sigma subunit (sigma70/sigma32)
MTVFFSLSKLDFIGEDRRLSKTWKGPLDVLSDEEMKEKLKDVMDTLSEMERASLLAKFRFENSLSVGELSDLWRCSRQRVYQLASQALARLKFRLNQRGF